MRATGCLMAYAQQKCPDCGGIQFVEDHAAGDVVCKVKRSRRCLEAGL